MILLRSAYFIALLIIVSTGYVYLPYFQNHLFISFGILFYLGRSYEYVCDIIAYFLFVQKQDNKEIENQIIAFTVYEIANSSILKVLGGIPVFAKIFAFVFNSVAWVRYYQLVIQYEQMGANVAAEKQTKKEKE